MSRCCDAVLTWYCSYYIHKNNSYHTINTHFLALQHFWITTFCFLLSFVAPVLATLFDNYFSLSLFVHDFMICLNYSAHYFPTTLATIVAIPILYNLYSFIFIFLYIYLSYICIRSFSYI